MHLIASWVAAAFGALPHLIVEMTVSGLAVSRCPFINLHRRDLMADAMRQRPGSAVLVLDGARAASAALLLSTWSIPLTDAAWLLRLSAVRP
ncbi:hypothetical protein XAXN_05325 [Xanthomonas axonopodis]|uniref:Uncharacterized protein n=1 Tax=Xanthomonas axonopodis TaxID=53413 RepID=A0A0P6VW73_9XANT|nr:hypothetical protein [Xanthomonas axonopodis]KPL49832.1 hypothetical protein XAXN_05325 [Xanthomonas axonopodis]